MVVVLAVLATVFFCILVFNLKSPGKRIEHEVVPAGDLRSPTVLRSIGQLLGPPLIAGNRITELKNGDQIFPAMLSAIASAKKTITFETFIYWSGEIGDRMADAFSERALGGVKVHVLIDWVGSDKMEDRLLEKMRRSGVIVERYRPLRWYNVSRVNNRTHRKILVIDGEVGFTGGVGIADQWQGHAQDPEHWRDSHFKVEGPVVAQLQAAFLDNWSASHPEVLHGDDYFPPLANVGDSIGQVFKSSPEEGSGSVRLMYLYAIAHARKTILLSSAYFVPDSHVIAKLCDARARGVAIDVIVPGRHIDTFLPRRASRGCWGRLLECGVRIYEYQPTMYHCKVMIVDGEWVSVGSTNFDNRSFRLNDESNLNVFDSAFAAQCTRSFDSDKALSREITLSEWQNRPIREKFLESVAWIFKSQL